MKFSAPLLLLLSCAATDAFVVAPSGSRTVAMTASPSDEIDYDAPTSRAAAVGNVVKTDKPSFMGVEVPPFIAKAMNLPYGDKGHFQVGDMDDMDEECYMGKDNVADDCVDFDPTP